MARRRAYLPGGGVRQCAHNAGHAPATAGFFDVVRCPPPPGDRRYIPWLLVARSIHVDSATIHEAARFFPIYGKKKRKGTLT